MNPSNNNADISLAHAELYALFDQLKATIDPSEKRLLLMDCSMLILLIGRLLRDDNERIRKLKRSAALRPPSRHVKS